MKPRVSSVLFLVATLLAVALPARAQLIFTLSGTATSTIGGYVSGNTYTFTLRTPSSYPTPPSNTNFTASGDIWVEDAVTDQQLWSAIGGTGLQGSFVRPTTSSGDPFSYVQIFTGGNMILRADNDSMYGIGLTTLGGSANNIHQIFIQITSGVPNFSYVTSFVDPVSYFTGYTGNYSVSGNIKLGDLNDIAIVNFTATSLSIATAIPEPASFAFLSALLCLGVVARWRKHDVR